MPVDVYAGKPACVQVPMIMGSFFILVRAAFCIAANLTTNEGVVNLRYAYLQGPDGKFWNYFDRGVLSNCLQFWLTQTPRPDWALIYQRETQVGPMYTCAAQPKRGDWYDPFSIEMSLNPVM